VRALGPPRFPEMLNIARGRGSDSRNPQLWNGLVGCWTMQEGGGSTVYDLSGHGNHGTLTNMDPATDWVVGPYGRALDFDGSDDYVNVAGAARTLGAASNLSLWIMVRPSFAGAVVDYLFDSSVGTTGLGVRLFNASRVDCFAYRSGGLAYQYATLNHNAWWNLCVVMENTNTRLQVYNDGVELATTDIGTGSGSLKASAQAIIGAEYTGANPLICQVAGVALYNRILTPAEIQHLYFDPWALFRPAERVYPVAVASTVKPWYYYQHLSLGAA